MSSELVAEYPVGLDTLVLIKKDHAKYLAGIRVKYDYELEFRKQSDSIIAALNLRVDRFIASEAELILQNEAKDDRIETLTLLYQGSQKEAEGYRTERDGYKSLWRRQKWTTWIIVLLGTAGTILGFSL